MKSLNQVAFIAAHRSVIILERFSVEMSGIPVRTFLLVFALAACMSASAGCTNHKKSSLLDIERAQQFVDKGTLELRRGDLARAQASFALALQLTPSPAAVDGLGCVALRQGEVEIAREHFVKAYEMDPEYAAAWGNMALLYEAKGELSAARKAYENALAGDPLNFMARNNFAVYLIERGEFNTGKRELLIAGAATDNGTAADNIIRLKGEGE